MSITKIKLRRGTLSSLNAIQLDNGEVGVTTDTKEMYVGMNGSNYNMSKNRNTIVPINRNEKEGSVGHFTRVSGTGTLSYDSTESVSGTGCFKISGNGTWVINSLHSISSGSGLSGRIVLKGIANISVGCRFYDSAKNLITPSIVAQSAFVMNNITGTSNFVPYKGNTKFEGTVANTMPSGSRFAQAYITISGNSGTVKFDEFDIFDMNPSVGVEPTQFLSGTSINWASGNTFSTSISSNTNFSFMNQQNGQVIVVRVINTSSSTLTLGWPGGLIGADTVLRPNKTKVYTFFAIGSDIYSSALEF